jgi:hypothetical protein
MKPFRVMVACCALGALAADAAPARAAWDNVFQVCFFHHRQPVTAGYYAAPVVPVQAYSSPCCPQTTCTTNYVQRCFYQPVTTYQSRTYFEPVTTYRTSYYYEPVTTYRYSCYVDPCTGCPQKVATPCTSYQLRSQCCPVQSWVQRCCSVPVTTYQRCSYWEPVTTCCQVPQPCCPAPAPCCPTGLTAAPAPPAVGVAVTPAPVPGPAAPPSVGEQRSLPPGPPAAAQQPQYYPPQPPVIQEQRSGPAPSMYDKYYGSGYRQPGLGAPAPVDPSRQTAPPPPAVKLDRIVLGPEGPIQGRVVRMDNAPRPGTRVVFVSADRKSDRQAVTANAAGRFEVPLGAGAWHVYLSGPDGRQEYHSRIEVSDRQAPFLTLVSR